MVRTIVPDYRWVCQAFLTQWWRFTRASRRLGRPRPAGLNARGGGEAETLEAVRKPGAYNSTREQEKLRVEERGWKLLLRYPAVTDPNWLDRWRKPPDYVLRNGVKNLSSFLDPAGPPPGLPVARLWTCQSCGVVFLTRPVTGDKGTTFWKLPAYSRLEMADRPLPCPECGEKVRDG